MKQTFVAIGLLAVANAAIAQGSEWKEPDYPLKGLYGGFDLGGWRFSQPVPGSSIEMTGFTYSPFVGYQLNRYMGIEGAYVGGNVGTNLNGVDLSTNAFVAQGSMIGSFPLSGYAGLYARAGVAKWWSRSTISAPGFHDRLDNNGTNGVYGAGVYEHFDVVASRLEWTRTNIEGARVNRFSVAAYWKF
jgi:hypothetical protein